MFSNHLLGLQSSSAQGFPDLAGWCSQVFDVSCYTFFNELMLSLLESCLIYHLLPLTKQSQPSCPRVMLSQWPWGAKLLHEAPIRGIFSLFLILFSDWAEISWLSRAVGSYPHNFNGVARATAELAMSQPVFLYSKSKVPAETRSSLGAFFWELQSPRSRSVQRNLKIKPKPAPAGRGARSWGVESRGSSWTAKWRWVRAMYEQEELDGEVETPPVLTKRLLEPCLDGWWPVKMLPTHGDLLGQVSPLGIWDTRARPRAGQP